MQCFGLLSHDQIHDARHYARDVWNRSENMWEVGC